MLLDAIDHVQLAMPPGGEREAVAFYHGVLGLPHVPKPEPLAARGGCWFEQGQVRIHLGVQDGFVPATKAHPALAVVDLDAMIDVLTEAGVTHERVDGPEGPQVYAWDPFGNRLELRPPRPTAGSSAEAAEVLDLARRVLPDGLAGAMELGLEADRLRTVERQSWIAGGVRRENSGEHSWHVALLALALAPPDVDVDRVVRMLLVHDLVELDAGDVCVYDVEGRAAKEAEEEVAADRLFGLLPGEQGRALRELWDEFEGAVSAEARFAKGVDRLAPFLLNAISGGLTWGRNGVDVGQVRDVCSTIVTGDPRLAPFFDGLLDLAVQRGWLPAS